MKRKILDNRPVFEDGFSGEGHRKTAKAIANAIEGFQGQTFMIGLEGKWGAGKSTIIELMHKELENSGKKYQVFNFDLWSNQTSNFKRALLETLLNWVEKQKCLSAKSVGLNTKECKNINCIRDKIRGSLIYTHTKNHKIFDGFGVISFLFIFLLPFIYSWTAPSVFRYDPVPIFTYFCIFLIVAFYILAIIKGAWDFFQKKESNFVEAVSSGIEIFSKDPKIIYDEKIIKEENPSQSEFYQTFREILDIYQTSSTKVVIVIDNIDRLTKASLTEAWSVIHAMMYSSEKIDQTSQNVIIVVPYNKDHVLSAFDSEMGIPDNKSNFLNNDIIRKTFDCVFHVSPPVLSDASRFFEVKFKEALFGNDDGCSYQIYKIFELSVAKQLDPATPRQIIHFINEITTIKEQWEKIPLPDIAVFVANSEILYSNPSLLRQPKTITQAYRDLANSQNLDKNLAGLAYNVDPELALQILLSNEIEDLLTQPYSRELRDLMSLPGVVEILPTILNENAEKWRKHNPDIFGNVVKNLIRYTPRATQLVCKRVILNNIANLACVNNNIWKDLHNIFDVVILAGKSDVDKTISDLSKWLEKCVETIAHTPVSMFITGEYWGAYISILYDNLVKVMGNEIEADSIIKKFHLFPNSEFILGVSYQCYQTKFRLNKLELTKSQDLIDNICQFLDKKPEIVSKALIELLPFLKEDDIDRLIEKLANDIILYISYEKKLEEKISTLCILVKEKKHLDNASSSKIIEVIDDGILFKVGRLETEKKIANEPLISNILCLFLSVHPDFSLASIDFDNGRLGNLTQELCWLREIEKGKNVSNEVINQIADFVVTTQLTEQIIENFVRDPDSIKIYVKILQAIAINHRLNFNEKYSYIKNYAVLKSKFSTSAIDKFLGGLGPGFPKQFKDYLLSDVLPVDFIRDLASRTEPEWTDFWAIILEFCVSIPSEDWTRILVEHQPLVNVFTVLFETGHLPGYPENVKKAFVKYAVDICVGAEMVTVNFDGPFKVLPINIQQEIAREFLARRNVKNIINRDIHVLRENCPTLLEVINSFNQS